MIALRPKLLCALGALTALLGAAPVAPVTPAARYPVALSRTAGGAPFVQEIDADAPLAGVQIFVAAGSSREPAGQSGVAALVAECVLRTPVSGIALKDALAASGGSITYAVDGFSTHYYIESRPAALAGLVTTFGRALSAPDFSAATLAAARTTLEGRIAESERSALSVGIAMIRRAYYSTGSGSALGSATTLAALGERGASAFYRSGYVRSALRVSAAGASAPAIDAALQKVATALPERALGPPGERLRPVSADGRRIVAHRDVGAPWIAVGFTAPPPNDPDFGAMLVLQMLLADAFERSSTTTLGFVERSVGAFYFYDSTPATVIVYVNGTLVDPSTALQEVLTVSKSLGSKPLGPGPLAHFKMRAEGQFLSDSVSLGDRSYLLGTLSEQGLGADPLNAALNELRATTPADIERAAKRYLQRYVVALVLPRQGPPAPRS